MSNTKNCLTLKNLNRIIKIADKYETERHQEWINTQNQKDMNEVSKIDN